MLYYLLPPSEGKNSGGQAEAEQLTFDFLKPLVIAKHATEKDLKCSGKRYEEGIALNKKIETAPTLSAIERYSGIMFKAIGYESMLGTTQDYFITHTCIFSGMYGLLKPQDRIGNYKLPIDTKGLYTFWKEQDITQVLVNYAEKNNTTLIDLLPGSYKKMIDRKKLDKEGVRYMPVNFYQNDNGHLKKLTHTVKKAKGNRLREICEKQIGSIEQLGGIQLEDEIQIVI